MKTLALVNGRVMLDGKFSEGQSVILTGSLISAVVHDGDLPADIPQFDLKKMRLVPGFIDLQVNGGADILFNDTPTFAAIEGIGAAHRRFGTTGFMPTLISDDLEIIRSAIDAVDSAIEAGVPGVLGIHIEGPFLNVERKGIHSSSKLRRLDDEGFEAITGLRYGKTLLTLAPECTTPEMIQRIVDAGVIVVAGHSNASFEETRVALASGVRGFTHLFNAMSQIGARRPGMVGAALEDANSWCSIIADGIHVHPAVLQIAMRAKGDLSKFMLVTDAMPSVGSTRDTFELQGQTINVRDGACFNVDGTLAGANLNMAQAVSYMASNCKVPTTEAINMASANPARFLGIDRERGTIAEGKQADLVALEENGEVAMTWIGGAISLTSNGNREHRPPQTGGMS